MENRFCTNCGNELKEGQAFCPKCGNKVGNDLLKENSENNKNEKDHINSSPKKRGTIILDIIRYVLALWFALGSVSDFMNEVFDISSLLGLLFAISLCPFLYRNFLNKYIKNLKLLKLIQILMPIVLFAAAIIAVPSDESIKNENPSATEPKGTIEEKTNWAVSHMLDKSKEAIEVFELNNETGKYDFTITRDELLISPYECAKAAIALASSKGVEGNENIGKIEYKCTDKPQTIYYVSVDNVHSLTEKNMEENTKYYDANHKEENTNIDKLYARFVSDYKKSCAKLKYKDVLRNPEDYWLSRAYWFGEIVQVVDKGNNGSTFRINVSCEKLSYSKTYFCSDTLYVTYYGNDSFIEDDMVKMWGTLEGTQTYTTVLGASVTIPKFHAEYIELQ